jgi:hypothetical protein
MEKYAKNTLVLAGGAGLVASVLSFIEHRVNTEDEFVPDFGRYLKIFLLVAACTYAALSVCCSQCPLKGGGSVPEVVKEAVVTNTSAAPWVDSGANVVEPIHTGTPNF